LENTPPLSKNSWSLLSSSSDSAKEAGVFGTFARTSGGSLYMFVSNGSPGFIFFSTPSSPAISIAANAKYGLQDGSGNLTSILFAFGEGEYIGILIAADLFLCE
jgi:hypothetical protein